MPLKRFLKPGSRAKKVIRIISTMFTVIMPLLPRSLFPSGNSVKGKIDISFAKLKEYLDLLRSLDMTLNMIRLYRTGRYGQQLLLPNI